MSELAPVATRAEHVSTGSAERHAVRTVKVTAGTLAPLAAEKSEVDVKKEATCKSEFIMG